MTVIAIASQAPDLLRLPPALRALDPSIDVVVWPDPRCAAAEVAVCWAPPPGALAAMPALRLLHTVSAGVDNVLAAPGLPDVPLCRVVDAELNLGMAQYILWGALYFSRGFDQARASQAAGQWRRPDRYGQPPLRVGLMGLGAIGMAALPLLRAAGLPVTGWSRTAKRIDGVATHHGPDGLAPFLAASDILVNLLPLTASTRGLLCAATFAGLPPGAALIHCGRGAHLVETDLQAALTDGRLRGALVDVYAQEPLPPRHPLWRCPNLVITPHMASVAPFERVAGQILENLRRLNAGEALMNLVDPRRGY